MRVNKIYDREGLVNVVSNDIEQYLTLTHESNDSVSIKDFVNKRIKKHVKEDATLTDTQYKVILTEIKKILKKVNQQRTLSFKLKTATEDIQLNLDRLVMDTPYDIRNIIDNLKERGNVSLEAYLRHLKLEKYKDEIEQKIVEAQEIGCCDNCGEWVELGEINELGECEACDTMS